MLIGRINRKKIARVKLLRQTNGEHTGNLVFCSQIDQQDIDVQRVTLKRHIEVMG